MNFPSRRQLESIDCGPTCIQMIAAYYKKKIALGIIKECCHTTRLGISLGDVIEGCKSLGLQTVAVHVKPNELLHMPLPAILYWEQKHYVVLYRIEVRQDKRIYYIADPAFGKVKLTEEHFMQSWIGEHTSGIAVLTEPTDQFYTLPEEDSWKKYIQSFKRPFRYLYGYKNGLIKALVCSVFTLICGWALPVILQRIIDDGVGQRDFNLVLLLLLGQLCFFLGNTWAGSMNSIILSKIGFHIGLDISTGYIGKLIKLPVRFFDTKLGTDLLQRLNDQDKIKDFLTYTLNSFLFAFLNLLVYSAILLYYNGPVFFLFLIFTLFTGLLLQIILQKRKLINYSLFSFFSRKKNIENELIHGMIDIKLFNADSMYLSKWENTQKEINNFSIKQLYLNFYTTSGTDFINKLKDILITGVCAYEVIGGNMSLGVMMTVTYVLGQLSGSVTQTADFVKAFQDAKLAFDRTEEIYKNEEESRDKSCLQASCVSGFRFRDVSFKYEGSFNPFVLNHITIDIPTGKVTAIVGASGSGKTTLLKLLLAFYYPQKGDLWIDDRRMSEMNPDEWRKKCGVVMQDGYIFSGTIAENIALTEEKPDKDRLQKAAAIACLDAFIEKLPMKYQTQTGKAGIELSGGQKQRLLIARAVYRNPEFIFFDEATSSLDANNERAIMSNLQDFYRGKTVVVIAHRLSTVRDADHIIVLEKGYVAEQGNHEELTAAKGKYYELVKNQLELGR